jgi:hypothetical protein
MNTESRLVEFINHTRLSDVPQSAMITLRRVLLAVSGCQRGAAQWHHVSRA